MTLDIEELGWDSDFFGFKVGKITLDSSQVPSPLDLDFNIKSKDFSLVYVFSNSDIQVENLASYKDEKVVFFKELSQPRKTHQNIFEATEEEFESLLTLAYASGSFSRFKLDPNIPEEKFHAMYSAWLEKSLERKIADKVLVFKEENQYLGFVTLRKTESHMNIGLIAVAENARGRNIGKELIFAAENAGIDSSCNYLYVPTQACNTGAMNFYRKCGFSEASRVFIYHIYK